jgi:hypothetical protein
MKLNPRPIASQMVINRKGIYLWPSGDLQNADFMALLRYHEELFERYDGALSMWVNPRQTVNC